MRSVNNLLSVGAAASVCGLLAVASVALAFLGSEHAGALMSHPPLLALTAVLAAGLAVTGVRAVARRRFDSALFHLGCACVMAGWLGGRLAVRAATPERPVSGAMVLVDGDESDKLYGGPELGAFVGRVPFKVRLEHFFIEHYPATPADRSEGRMPPVREYRSRVTITPLGGTPFVRNVRVNHPAFVQGYHIYQMSWGQSQDPARNPVIYTVLQFIRDPGLPAVYAGFVILFAGVLLFAARVLTAGRPCDAGEVRP